MKITLLKSNQKQKTLKKKFSFIGKESFSGLTSKMICYPAKSNTGIIFKIDNKEIPANFRFVKKQELHTTVLAKDGVEILGVEHLLAAFWGLGLDNVVIELVGRGLPMVDGSAEGYSKAIKQAGVIELKEYRKVIKIKDSFNVNDDEFDERGALFSPNPHCVIEATVSFPPPLNTYSIKYTDSPNKFIKEISWARTFLRSPLDETGEKWQRVRMLYKVLPKNPKESPIITFTEKKFITPLILKDEPARHKVLDLIGDLSLIGYRVLGKIEVNKPGHSFTHKIAALIGETIA